MPVRLKKAPISGGAPEDHDDTPQPKEPAGRSRDIADVAEIYRMRPGRLIAQ